MIGAIIGDIVGSRFEWNNIKSKNFELFTDINTFTDDTVMTCAIAQALMKYIDSNKKEDLSKLAIEYMQKLGREYPDAGYGFHFNNWIYEKDPKPYNSFGNGSAMRVSACGWVANSLLEAKELAIKVSCVTHNHKEGIKGAVAIAQCIYLARNKKSKEEICQFVRENYYKLDFKLDEIRLSYTFDVSCQGSVPQAIECFLESNSYEDCIRNAISLGGDSDTIGAIAGSIAEAYYGVDKKIVDKSLEYLDENLKLIVKNFNKYKIHD